MPPAWRKMIPWEWTWMDMKMSAHRHSMEPARNPTLPNSSDELKPKSNKLCTRHEYQATRYLTLNLNSIRRPSEHLSHLLLFPGENRYTMHIPHSGHPHSHLPSRPLISHFRPLLSLFPSKTSTFTPSRNGQLKTGLNSPSTKYLNLKLFASLDN